MSFAQTEYLPFLVLVLGLWPFVAGRWRTAFLLLASFVFYVWVRPTHAPLLVLSILVDFGIGLGLGRTSSMARRKLLLWTSVVFNVGMLAFFKYAEFLVQNVAALFGASFGTPELLEGLVLPLGISFYTFQTLSYTIDVYGGRQEPCRDLVRFGLFVSFFPQLVAGPIERAGHLLPQLERLQELRPDNLSYGARRILWGLGKKWLVADRLLAFAGPVFRTPGEQDSATLLACAIAMSAVIYIDFSAYSDIAIGSARLFGVRLVENFDRPFLATSVEGYVKRWHVSLVTWMFDYVFGPLSRRMPTHWRLWRNNLFVLGLFGLWHGASWTFVLWGVGFGVLVSMRQSLRLSRRRRGVRRRSSESSSSGGLTWRTAGAWFVSLCLSSQVVVLFFSPNLAFAREFYAAEFSARAPSAEGAAFLGGLVLTLLALFAVHASGRLVSLSRVWERLGPLGRAASFIAGAIALFAWRVGDVRPFIYFEF